MGFKFSHGREKMSREWQINVDFTILNLVSPRDSYPLPSIDELVEALDRKW